MKEISTTAAPESIGPFSQGLVTDSTVYVSGQGPIDPESGDIINGDVREQTKQTLENVRAVLDAAGCSLDDIVKATVFVTDMDTYEAVNEVYGEYMNPPFPARSAVEVSSLPVPIDVEIEVIAEQ
ncbi:dfrA (plasmid) [Halostagnicola larsenii XH-48]|uniref:DfrA n=1 Tax=Halostagnicola larsenii XH-48 TaxID=797299 RepID=W0JTF4_9EURY|nr:Rid family detoxifying hydrolase [Halostagnicola larsenii]AHG01906.1 dfrA [Halostagnicola larsenii XH-48]